RWRRFWRTVRVWGSKPFGEERLPRRRVSLRALLQLTAGGCGLARATRPDEATTEIKKSLAGKAMKQPDASRRRRCCCELMAAGVRRALAAVAPTGQPPCESPHKLDFDPSRASSFKRLQKCPDCRLPAAFRNCCLLLLGPRLQLQQPQRAVNLAADYILRTDLFKRSPSRWGGSLAERKTCVHIRSVRGAFQVKLLGQPLVFVKIHIADFRARVTLQADLSPGGAHQPEILRRLAEPHPGDKQRAGGDLCVQGTAGRGRQGADPPDRGRPARTENPGSLKSPNPPAPPSPPRLLPPPEQPKRRRRCRRQLGEQSGQSVLRPAPAAGDEAVVAAAQLPGLRDAEASERSAASETVSKPASSARGGRTAQQEAPTVLGGGSAKQQGTARSAVCAGTDSRSRRRAASSEEIGGGDGGAAQQQPTIATHLSLLLAGAADAASSGARCSGRRRRTAAACRWRAVPAIAQNQRVGAHHSSLRRRFNSAAVEAVAESADGCAVEEASGAGPAGSRRAARPPDGAADTARRSPLNAAAGSSSSPKQLLAQGSAAGLGLDGENLWDG
uniref:DNA-directed RNA polymerase n=1 Tax=Macrostomum lignano TaxID=282301 RepID=A0A1I8F700_9PLAT